MKVKPSKRPKKRYIWFETSQGKNQIEKFLASLTKSFSVKSLKKINTHFRGIIRVKREEEKQIVKNMNNHKDYKTLGVSGVIKKAFQKVLT
tara:strand:- start:281 stop:553 length:273 start_codon:yes stop_codon:yes gene_type:complete